MADILSKKQRSVAMSKVRCADTKPEWILRCGLHRLGFRYRLRNRHLPGRPDLAFPKYRAVVFVHGCYWHRHENCKLASMPKQNNEFWIKKFNATLRRDGIVYFKLKQLGWRVSVIWECATRDKVFLPEHIKTLVAWLKSECEYIEIPEFFSEADRL